MTTASIDAKRKTGDVSKAAAAGPLSAEELRKIHAYWRAANYLSVGQIYLMDNPLLKEPLQLKHVKPRLLGHWGTTSGQNFLYVHLNRVIKKYDLNMLYISGPGHGGPALPERLQDRQPHRARAHQPRGVGRFDARLWLH